MSVHMGGHLRLSASRIRPLRNLSSHHERTSSLTVKSCTHRVQGRRRLHIAPFLQASVEGTEQLITTLHTVTGTPWYVTLPLVALGVNAIFRLPFIVYARKIGQRRGKLAPILQAWYAKIVRTVEREPIPPSRKAKEVTSRFNKTSKRIYKEWGLQQWRMQGSLFSLPFWLVAIESIRRLCGGPRGLIGTLVFGKKEAIDNGNVVSATASASNPAEVISSMDVATIEGVTAPGITDIAIGAADPTLATGGCLWFPNLMESDPLHILPCLLSAMLVVNILSGTKGNRLALFGLQDQKAEVDTTSASSKAASKQSTASVESPVRRGLQRGLIILSLMVGPATLDLPAALHLYWLSSAGFSYLLHEGLRRLIPTTTTSLKPARGFESPLIRPPPPP